MTLDTHITAGPLAAAGARLGVGSLAACTGHATLPSYVSAAHPVSSGHPTTLWTQGAIAKQAGFMAFDGKNRPTRPLSEHSP